MDSAFRLIELGDHDLALWLHAETDPADDEWDHGTSKIAMLKRERHGDLSALRTMIISDGGAPNSKQRAKLFSLFNEPSKASLVTSALANPFKRSVATVITWLNPEFRAFTPERVADALSHIDLLDRRASIFEEFHKMQATLPPIKTLQRLLRHVQFEAV